MKMPQKNLSTLDRLVRGVIGIITIYFGLFGGDLIGEPIVQGILVIFWYSKFDITTDSLVCCLSVCGVEHVKKC